MRLIEEVKAFPSRVHREVTHFPAEVKTLHKNKNWRFFCWLVAAYSVCLIAVGVNYSPVSTLRDRLPNGLDIVAMVLSTNTFAVLWLFLGLWGIFSALSGLRSLLAFKAMVCVCMIWAFAYLAGQLMEGGSSWPSAFTYFRASIAPLMVIWVVTSRKAYLDGR